MCPRPQHDVFISYNSRDFVFTRRLADWLQAAGLKVWFDRSSAVAGQPWVPGLQVALASSRAVLVCFGEYGPGKWEQVELEAALIENVIAGRPLIPVILPNCRKSQPLPLFLQRLTAVDFRPGSEPAARQLLRGITGQEPAALLPPGPFTSSALSPPRSGGSRRLVLGLSFIAGLFLLLAILLASRVPSLAATTFHRVVLNPTLTWSVSGVWSADESELILADPNNKRLVRYSPRTGLGTPALTPQLSPLPHLIQPDHNRFLLECDQGKMIWLGKDLVPLKEAFMLKGAASSQGVLDTFPQWVLVGEEVLSISDYKVPLGDSWEHRMAFLRFPVETPTVFDILLPLEGPPSLKRLYLFGNPYVASVQGRGYFLLMGVQPRLCEARKWAQVDCFDLDRKDALQQPRLPNASGEANVKTLYYAWEQSAATAGIYGWKDSLYILNRRPGRSGLTIWQLARVDLRRRKVLYAKPLPTVAHHLTVIPGRRQWAFVEKGEVKGLGNQQISRVLFLPTSWIESPEATLHDPGE